jgi:hypothetical protein
MGNMHLSLAPAVFAPYPTIDFSAFYFVLSLNKIVKLQRARRDVIQDSKMNET